MWRQSKFELLSVITLVLTCALVMEAGAAPSKYRERNKQREEKAVSNAKAEVTDIMPESMEGLPPEIVALYGELEKEGNRGAVPICVQMALIHWDREEYEETTRLLDLALLRITGSSVGEEGARKARSTFHAEDEKIFRGEPYEQAVVHMLRGLLYMREGDYENARALFRSGALCDRSSDDAPADEQYHDDMVEMDYLEALCNVKLGNPRVADNLKRARDNARNAGAVQDPPEQFNTVFLFLSGNGPTKYATGEYAQFLRFKPGNGASGPMRAEINGEEIASVDGPLDNMSFQATTRGGREIDAILKGKAQFKTGANVVGDLALISGAAAGLAGGRDAPGLGIGLAIVGIAAKGIAAAANPAADTRMLPVLDDVYIFPAQITPGEHALTVQCPETDVSETYTFKADDRDMNIVILTTTRFASNVNTRRYATYTQNKASIIETAQSQWTGTIKDISGETPLRLFITETQDDAFTGFVEYSESMLPCKGALDAKAMRLEFSKQPDRSYQTMLTGKVSNRGRASSGAYYLIGGGNMTPAGQFKLARVDETTGKPAPPSKGPASQRGPRQTRR